MSKKFQLVNFDVQGPSTSCTVKTDWKLCVICQEHTSEVLRRPLQNSQVDKGSGYTSLAEHLIQFTELGQLPSTLPTDWMRVTVLKQLWLRTRLSTIIQVEVQWHEVEQNKKASMQWMSGWSTVRMHVRRSQPSWTPGMTQEDICFFCRQPGGNEGFHRAEMFKVHKWVGAAATLLQERLGTWWPLKLRITPDA